MCDPGSSDAAHAGPRSTKVQSTSHNKISKASSAPSPVGVDLKQSAAGGVMCRTASASVPEGPRAVLLVDDASLPPRPPPRLD